MQSWLLLVLLSVAYASGQQVIVDESYTSVVYRALLVPRNEFNHKNVEELSRSFLKAHSNVTLAKFQVVTEKYQAWPVPRSPMATFDSWLRSFQKLKTMDWTMAETLCLADSAVMRLRDGTGQVTRIILSGNDALTIVIGPIRYTILHIDFARTPAGSLANVRVFVTTSKQPDIGSAESVVRQLSQKLQLRRMTVNFRSDPWFAADGGFPDYHPFSHEGRPPTESEYNASRTVYCGDYSGRIKCNATGE